MLVRVRNVEVPLSGNTSLEMVASLPVAHRKFVPIVNQVFTVKGVAALTLVSVLAVGHPRMANVSVYVH